MAKQADVPVWLWWECPWSLLPRGCVPHWCERDLPRMPYKFILMVCCKPYCPVCPGHLPAPAETLGQILGWCLGGSADSADLYLLEIHSIKCRRPMMGLRWLKPAKGMTNLPLNISIDFGKLASSLCILNQCVSAADSNFHFCLCRWLPFTRLRCLYLLSLQTLFRYSLPLSSIFP